MVNHFLGKIFILLLFVLSPSYSFAQTPCLQHFTVEDGLPSSNVYVAFQDKDGLMWFSTENGVVRFDGYSFESFNTQNSNISTDIWDIEQDDNGNLWFNSDKQITYLENNQFKILGSSPSEKESKIDATSTSYAFHDKGNYFMQFLSFKDIHNFKLDEDKPLKILKTLGIDKRSHTSLLFLKEDNKGQEWFIANSEKQIKLIKTKDSKVIKIINLSSNFRGNLTHYLPIEIKENTFVVILKDKNIIFHLDSLSVEVEEKPFGKDVSVYSYFGKKDNLILLKTNQGYKVMSPKLEVLSGLGFLDNYTVNRIFEDKTGNIWICTKNQGLFFLPKNGFDSKIITLSENHLFNNDISHLIEDDKKQIWFINKKRTLHVLKKDGTIKTTHFSIPNTHQNDLYFNKLSFNTKGDLLIGSTKNTFILIPNEKLEKLPKQINLSFVEINSRAIPKSIKKDLTAFNGLGIIKSINLGSDNKQYLTTSHNIYQVSSHNDDFVIKYVGGGKAYSSTIWRNKLWLGRSDGLYTLDFSNQKDLPVKDFLYGINKLGVSKKDKLWIATEINGLYRFDGQKTDTIKTFFDTRITINSMYFDEDNTLWMATNKGLATLKITNEAPFQYNLKWITKAYGLISNETNDVITQNDKIYVATSKGIAVLNKEDLNKPLEKEKLRFTNIIVNGKIVPIQDKLIFSHNNNNIRLNYVCPSFSSMGNIEYEYMMEGIDKGWQTTAEIFKEYPTLPSGQYIFRIRAKNMNGLITDEHQIRIIIKLPWWKTWTAILSAILLLSVSIYALFQYQIKRSQEKQEKHQLEALSELKSRFYANVTHEFRTPLTLILGMVRFKNYQPAQIPDIFKVIEKHGTRLLNLINQLLDLNKLELNQKPLKLQNGDIVVFLNYLIDLFQPAAQEQNIQLFLYKEVDELFIDYDADKFQSVIFNLLSNALKFTPNNGQIIIHLKTNQVQDQFTIRVKDTGTGIEKEALPFIFNRFYQEAGKKHNVSSTGIGLALVKELVTQMQGTIGVTSNSNGTTFTIQLPINRAINIPKTELDLETKDLKRSISVSFSEEEIDLLSNASYPDNTNKPLILLVEDNNDVLNYLKAIIGQSYRVETAIDGAIGIEKAIEIVPDFIISDIMMPNKDGFELCETLKNNEKTSHIPIILLTAKTHKTTQLQGLKYGADAYITKPFHQEELMIRINQLLELRQKLRHRYQSSELPKLEEVTEVPTPILKKEDAFILKLREVIQKHLDDTTLNVPFLCKELKMSRTQLHNKITYLTGNSTTKFIQKVRLEKSIELLENSELNISEIAYEIGLDVKYFSRLFNQTYSCPPSKYRKKHLKII